MMKKTRILHIANSYWANKLYRELILAINRSNIFQTVFVPIRHKSQDKSFNIINDNIKIIYTLIASSIIYRVLFILKVKKSITNIDKNIDISKIDIIHAHTLFSDGAIAYHYYKKYNIPYIVAIRNVDINEFIKYLIYLRPLGRNILKNAARVVFLSESYKQRIINHYVRPSERIDIAKKSIIIPNGISQFWLDNRRTQLVSKEDDNFTLVFAGEFVNNKNIINVIKAVILLNKQGYKLRYNIIGEGYRDNAKYLELIKNTIKNIDNISILPVQDKEGLLKLYRESDIFIMPSFTETFGLVYAEALTQGLPVIYTKGEGFDKVFPEAYVGLSVNPNDINDIANSIIKIIHNYNNFQKNCVSSSNKFSWETISQEYINNYIDIKKAKNAN